jgi:5,10-methenyltetrahydromethanopterin hydrogenase
MAEEAVQLVLELGEKVGQPRQSCTHRLVGDACWMTGTFLVRVVYGPALAIRSLASGPQSAPGDIDRDNDPASIFSHLLVS